MRPYCPKICSARLHRHAGQPEWLATLLMTGQVIPEPLDQGADQLIGLVHVLEHGEFAAPQVLDDHHGRGRQCRGRDIAEKPRAHFMEWHRTAMLLEQCPDRLLARSLCGLLHIRSECPT